MNGFSYYRITQEHLEIYPQILAQLANGGIFEVVIGELQEASEHSWLTSRDLGLYFIAKQLNDLEESDCRSIKLKVDNKQRRSIISQIKILMNW